MSLDSEPLTGISSSERLYVTVTFEPMTFKIPKVLYFVCHDLELLGLTSKFNSFIFVPNCIYTCILNFLKFPLAVRKISCSQT